MALKAIDVSDMLKWQSRQDRLLTCGRHGITIHGDPEKGRDHQYFIDWQRLTDAEDTLAWVFHLGQKNWVTREILCRFIDEVSKYRGIDIYNLR